MSVNVTMPSIPDEIYILAGGMITPEFNIACLDLWVEVRDEMMTSEFITRSHHNVGTYDRGCRGPLCRKALREHPRRRPVHGVALQVREERIYDPVLDYYHTVMKHRIRKYQQELMKEIS